MNREEFRDSLEGRLADEARRLLDDGPRWPPIANLRAEFARRRRQRALARRLCTAAAASAVTFALIATGRGHRPGIGIEPVAAIADGAAPPTAAVAHNPEAPHAGVSGPSAKAGPPPYMAIVILMPPAADGDGPTLVPGWYVPEHVEVIDPKDLSQAEREAASRLLKTDFDGRSDDVI